MTFIITIVAQPGVALFPTDSNGNNIDDGSKFLETWEVSRCERTRPLRHYRTLYSSLQLNIT